MKNRATVQPRDGINLVTLTVTQYLCVVYTAHTHQRTCGVKCCLQHESLGRQM